MQGKKLTVKSMVMGAVVVLFGATSLLVAIIISSRRNITIAILSGTFLIALILTLLFGLGWKGLLATILCAYSCLSLGMLFQWVRENLWRDME